MLSGILKIIKNNKYNNDNSPSGTILTAANAHNAVMNRLKTIRKKN